MTVEELEGRVARLEHDQEVLSRQMTTARQQLRDSLFWLDVHCSWPWKRIWWALHGFRLYRLGRWKGSSGKGRYPWFD